MEEPANGHERLDIDEVRAAERAASEAHLDAIMKRLEERLVCEKEQKS
jgi:hypothetical protein